MSETHPDPLRTRNIIAWSAASLITTLVLICGYFAAEMLSDIRSGQRESLAAQDRMAQQLARIGVLVDVSGRATTSNAEAIEALRNDVGNLKQRVSVIESWRGRAEADASSGRSRNRTTAEADGPPDTHWPGR